MRICTALVFLLVALPASAQVPDSTAEVSADSAAWHEANRLGHLLFTYDQAAWHGTDAVMHFLQADEAHITDRFHFYVAQPDGSGWRVAFGRLAPDSSAFIVAYEARLDSVFAVTGAESFETPVAQTGYVFDAGRALDAAAKRFRASQPVRYNTATLPAPDGQVYVYLLPSQPATDVYYVGADVRYTYSPAAGRIIEEKPLHTALLTMDLRDHPEAVTMSSAVLTDVPTETDVFYAISRPTIPVEAGRPAAAHHFVTTQTHVFVLAHDGIIAGMTKQAWERVMAMQGSGQPSPAP